MAATKSANTLDNFAFRPINNQNTSEAQQIMNIMAEKPAPAISTEKKDENKTGRPGYHITIRFPQEYKMKLKLLALQEFDDNITTYINKLVEEDFKRRGIK